MRDLTNILSNALKTSLLVTGFSYRFPQGVSEHHELGKVVTVKVVPVLSHQCASKRPQT